MTDFLTVAETASLLEISERAVRKNALSGKYGQLQYIESSAGGRGGRMLQISLDALPESYQQKYREEQGLTAAAAPVETVSDYDLAPAWAREKAHQKRMTLEAYEAYLQQPGKKGELAAAFVEKWNEAHPEEPSVSKSTLSRWQKEYQEQGISALLPQYGQNKGKRFSMSEKLFNEFIRLLKKKIKIADCHRILAAMAAENGESCPSDDTLRRIAKELPQAVLVAIQDGKKAFYNKVQTFTRRDPESVKAGQVFVGDHRRLDFFILGPNKTWVRPWVTAWMDMRSGKLVGWIVTCKPNSDTIKASFAVAALDPTIGLPREIYIDNGRDYSNEHVAGRGFREKKAALEADRQRVVPMMERLGITVHFAIPENARAKTIERVAFMNMSNWFDLYMETYCGRNSAQRPDDLGDKLKSKEARYKMTLEELTTIFDDYVRHIYNKRVSERGRGREGECPDETFIRTRLPVRQTSEALLVHFLQRQTGRYRVGRNGITFRGREYYSPDMVLHKGKDVLISQRHDDPDSIFIFDLDERPLFKAAALGSIDALHADSEAMHAEGSRKKAEWEAVKAHPAWQAAQSGQAPSMSEIIELFKKSGSPDPKPTAVSEMVPVPAELREALMFNQQQATGTDGMSIFEMMHGVKIENRKGE